ncbi:hypothetical protein SLEP1_g32216 [Rubroshorea leprosula]|uniref:Uncharacterized protein n=1 Tax=Rubroshorea leprosula TaxID=152421 RepID=A0AAV5KCV0_9ROSI|nr:hypothetical protein SLEP1_g32216 [Rubroshorea leprosula]
MECFPIFWFVVSSSIPLPIGFLPSRTRCYSPEFLGFDRSVIVALGLAFCSVRVR